MAEQVSFKDLLGTGAHFGHVTHKWHPNYEQFILMERNGVHIINLEETVKHLDKAIDFIKTIVEKNGEVLFVGTKKQAKDIVQQEADKCGMFYIVERWLGGTLTNFSTIKKSIKRLKILEKEGSSIYNNLTKKEIQMLNRERVKLSDQHRGIKDMRRLPDAIVIVDVDRELTALKEARILDIPVIAMVDSNCDPRVVNYPIPANDDSIRTIQLIIAALADAVNEVKDAKAVKEEELAVERAEAKLKAEADAKAEKAAKQEAERAVKVEKKAVKIDEKSKTAEKKVTTKTLVKKTTANKVKAAPKTTATSKTVKKTTVKQAVKEIDKK